MFANALGTASMMLGKFNEARKFLDEARRVQAPVGGTFAVVISESVEGAIDLLRGHLPQAIARLRGATEPRNGGPNRYAKANALAGVLLAEALYETDEREESERLVSGHLPVIQEGGIPDQLISGHVLMARLSALKGDHEQAFQTIMELEYLGHRLQLPRVCASARLERANLALGMGQVEAADEELKLAADAQVWPTVASRFMVANDAETYEIAELRWMCHSGRAEDAVERLRRRLLPLAESERRARRVLKLRILLSKALATAGQTRQGVQELLKALRLGHRGGFIRSFADEGDVILGQIQEILNAKPGSTTSVPQSYMERILAAGGLSPSAAARRVAGSLVEPLTRKEIGVLKLVAEGLSNRSLAQQLFLSETTIRTHLRNINAKLGVHSRVRAIVVARMHGYIG